MTFEIYKADTRQSLMPFLADEAVSGSVETISGPNAGTNILGRPILDAINRKYVITIVTRYLTDDELSVVAGLLTDNKIQLRTDYFEDNEAVYEGYRGAISRTKIAAGWSKLSVSFDCYK